MQDRISIQCIIGRRVLKHDLSEVGIELLGQYHRDRCINALSHLNIGHDQRNFAIAADADERIGSKVPDRRCGLLQGQREPQQQSASCEAGVG